MKKNSVLFLLIVLTAPVLAQSWSNVKADSETFYWGEGWGFSVAEADKNALADLISKIVVNVSSKTTQADEESVEDDYVESKSQFSSITNTYSYATLNNTEKIIIENEPDAHVGRWVAKSEVDKMFELREQKILDFIQTGKIAEQRLQIDDALRNYYWALMLAKANIRTVYTEFNGENVNCLTFLPMKIKSVISHIKAELKECISSDNRHHAQMHFTYEGHDVASVQLRYFDGQSFVGPIVAKDGLAELDLLSLPADGKIRLHYDYNFRTEAENLDAELRAIYTDITTPIIENASVDVPVKVDLKKNVVKSAKQKSKDSAAKETADVADLPSEPIQIKQRIEMVQVTASEELEKTLRTIENAIRQENPRSAYEHFTPEGYKLFESLLTKTGHVSLIGNVQNYEFLKANGQILGRFCKIKIKFKNGQSFTENLVFRFDEKSLRIQSIAFALSKKAEDDIFNAAATWPDISRFTILQFMEDYQTAYALKRLDYIEKIFSDDAIIITGTVLKTLKSSHIEGKYIGNFGNDEIRYSTQTKQQYLTRLRKHFNDREYIHLTFEDNKTKVINAPRIPKGTAFAIQINQMYNSPVYSDKGYLTLVLDASKELPIIHVRLWQPDKTNMLTLDQFMNKFEF